MRLALVSPVAPWLTTIELPPEIEGSGGMLKVEPETLVWKAPAGDAPAIYKMYRRRGAVSWWRERHSRFRVQREHESLVYLRRSGVSCAPPVAWGYGTHPEHGRFEVLVTLEVPNAQTMGAYVSSHPEPDEGLLASAFALVRRMHRCGVYHGRLDLRNMLAAGPKPGQMACHIIDTPQAIVFPADIAATRMARHDLMHFAPPFVRAYGADFGRRMLTAYGLTEPLLGRAIARLPSYRTSRHGRNWYRFEFGLRALLAHARERAKR
jgi:hypothetical protein